MDRPQRPGEAAVVGLIDTANGNQWTPLAETRAWNWQQGTMLHWLDWDPAGRIIYNDVRDGQFVAVTRKVHSAEERVLPRPVYNVSRDGHQAVTLNFSRVHRCRPGYGYCALPDPREGELHPAEDGIYWMDLETGENRLILSLDQIVGIRHDATMDGVEHWFNHLLFNQDGSRFIFLHRWVRPETRNWYTRMFTATPDGSDICCLSDHELVSHFDWRNPRQVLAWATRHEVGNRYFLFDDQTEHLEVVGEGTLTCDGHCSYSPDGRWILTDTYPAREDHKRTLLLYRPTDDFRVDVGRFYSPPELQGEIRCDLHPRWSRDGKRVCFDSLHEGTRQLYVMDVTEVVG
ncbi:MAG: hypothetical protein GW802_38655 [Armatimonadetes bacterium]|nr:hypothetical protein [Armatimonadota bacterium]